MLKFLENLDQFGVAFQPRIQYSKTKQRTALGGFMSLLLYGLSFAYLVYVFIQWQSGTTLPKVTNSQKIVTNSQFQLNETYLQFQTRQFQVTKIDPFNPQALILQPKIYYFRNGKMIKSQSIDYPDEQIDGFHLVNLQNLSLHLSDENSEEKPDEEIMITLGQCQEKTLIQGQKCANQTIIDAFFSQPINTLIFKQYLKQFNTQSQTIETIGRESMISVQKSAVFQIQTYVRVEQSIVDTGPLFESINEYQYITDYRADNAVLNLDYFSPVLGFNAYVVLYYKLDNIQSVQTITYPKLSEVLAEASSIASTLLLLSYLVIVLNESQLSYQAVNGVISMYYPEFKAVKITKNIFGKILKVEKNGKFLDVKIFQQNYEKWRQISEAKLTISNQIYEISRIQFLLQSLISQEKFKKIHNLGISLPNILSMEDCISKLDVSQFLEQQQFKQNTIIPNPEIQIDPSKENKFSAFPDIYQYNFKDSDFDLFLLPEEEYQFP